MILDSMKKALAYANTLKTVSQITPVPGGYLVVGVK